MVNDPIADMLTRIRNSLMAGHETLAMPVSRMKLAIAKILQEEGFITGFEVVKGKPQRMIKITLRRLEKNLPVITGLKRVSRPGLRVYVGRQEIPRVYGGLGVAIISTSQGVMTGKDAWRRKLGGELLCYVW